MSLKRRLLDHTIAPLHHLTESQKASFTIQRIPPKLLSPNRVARTINQFDKITATGHGKSAAPVYDRNKSDMSHAVYHEDKRVLGEETTHPVICSQIPHSRGKKQNKRAGTAHHKKMQEENKPMTRADSLPTCRHGSRRMLDQVGDNWVDEVCWFHAQNAKQKDQDCQRRRDKRPSENPVEIYRAGAHL
jgi:hypothetical protein